MGRGRHLTNKIEGGGEVLTHEETLKILSEMARNGSVTAAVAMARELRLDPGDEDLDLELDDELERLLRRDGVSLRSLYEHRFRRRDDSGKGILLSHCRRGAA
jgi:hypothetical protein